MEHPEPKKIREYLKYARQYEDFCLLTRANQFPLPEGEKLERIREVADWLIGLSKKRRPEQ